jgi:hypothetical protein
MFYEFDVINYPCERAGYSFFHVHDDGQSQGPIMDPCSARRARKGLPCLVWSVRFRDIHQLRGRRMTLAIIYTSKCDMRYAKESR